MQKALYFRGDISKISNNLNLVYKPNHDGAYSAKAVTLANNFPMAGEFAFIEIIPDRDGDFCIQRVYVYSTDTIPLSSPYNADSSEYCEYSYCFIRSGIIKEGFISWGAWGKTFSNIPTASKNDYSSGLGWIENNLIPKIPIKNSTKVESRKYNQYGIHSAYKIPLLELLNAESRLIKPMNLEEGLKNLVTPTKIDGAFMNELIEFFAFRYLGEVKGKDFSTWFNGFYGLKNHILVDNGKYLINGYFIKKPGVEINIPDTNIDSYGILKVYSVPLKQDSSNLQYTTLSRFDNDTEALKIPNRDGFDRWNVTSFKNYFRNTIMRMYVYYQTNPAKAFTQYIWSIDSDMMVYYNTDKWSSWNFNYPLPQSIMRDSAFDYTTLPTFNNISAIINSYGWVDMLKMRKTTLSNGAGYNNFFYRKEYRNQTPTE